MSPNGPHLVGKAATRACRLKVDQYPRAVQGSLNFEAYGHFPLQNLRFTFFGADGTLVHAVRPLPGASGDDGVLARIGRWPLALWLQYLTRQVLRRPVKFHLDLPADCVAQGQVTVSMRNIGSDPVLVGKLALRTSTLAPQRMVRNSHAIEGYSDRISVCAGEPLQLFVHAPRGRFSLTVYRYGACVEPVLHIADIAGKAQDYPANAYEKGAGWEPTFTLPVGESWRSGMYAANISDESGEAFDITFIVKKAKSAVPAGLAVLASTHTWQAYNPWGGASLYSYQIDDGLDKPDVFLVHTQRPNPAATPAGSDGHLANAEKHVLKWLEQNAIPYDLYADSDLHDEPCLLRQYSTLLINTHSEYWSAPMYSGLENFMNGGGNLAYLSGNGLFWKAAVGAGQLEVRYDYSRHTLVDEAGGRWRDYSRPEANMLGVHFTRAGYKSNYKPYKVISPRHWVFDGTAVAKGDLIGKYGLNTGGASGWELDKIDPAHRPHGLVHLARGTNGWGRGADMVYFTHPGGGGVFSVGSITFGGSLAIDPVLSKMLRNVLDRFLD
jgi:hypothetical protein